MRIRMVKVNVESESLRLVFDHIQDENDNSRIQVLHI